MTKPQLMVDLYAYRDMCTRLDVLKYRIEQAERQYSTVGAEAIAGAQLRSPQLTGMPTAHGNVSSPTERTAMELMSFPDEKLRLEFETELREFDTLTDKKRQLDIMLGGLREKERFIIMAHLISGLSWRETGRRFALEYGEELSESALKYIMRQGLERMMGVSKQMEVAG